MDLIREVTQEYLRSDIPDFRPGDNLKVHVRLKEGEKERIQVFEGLVIARKHGGVSETFTVRKISSGVGVERTFPLHSPSIAKVEVTRRGRVRRAKLYYLRDRVGKKTKVKELVHEGNVRRIIVQNEEGKTLIEIPLTLGVVGALLLPTWAALGALAAIVTECKIVVEREDEPEETLSDAT